MKSRLKAPNFSYLLAGLLLVLFLDPILIDFFDYNSTFLTSLSFSATMILGVWSLHESKNYFYLGISLICCSLIISLIVSMRPELMILRLLDLAILLTFCAMSFMFILGAITVDLNVDANRVVGGVCLYLVIGIIFAIFYIVIEIFLPGSFKNLPKEQGYGGNTFFYYSFVTLTTLGYGDIAPIRPFARMVAAIESLVGVFYMSILIGSMIGLLLGGRNNKST